MGLPIGDIVLGSNANDVLPRYFSGGETGRFFTEHGDRA